MWAWLIRCVYFLLRDNQACLDVRTVFTYKIKLHPGILFPDRAGASKRTLGRRGREQPSVETIATGHGLHLSERETGLTGT